jgi:uncharacterized membrane protein YfcA
MLVALAMVAGGALAGGFGSLLGLGGGVLLVPLLTLGFELPLREAVGVSLVAVITTSGASASVYLERGVANLRLGMTLELFTAIGAMLGGLIAFLIDEQALFGLFAALLVYTSWTMARQTVRPSAASPEPDLEGGNGFSASLSGDGYAIQRVPIGATASVGGGVVSALLGIGGGLVLVPVMHVLMGTPLRVATATSNLMIGVTAAAGAIVYLLHGGIDPYVAGPTAVGVFLGATAGSRLGHRIDVRYLRLAFVVVLLYTAVQMGRLAIG